MANTLKLGAGKWATGTDTVLAFNDENNNFKPLPFDFSRASSATVVNQSGLIETVGSGEPRIDFLGNTKGALLLEPSRTNIVPYSQTFTGWSLTNALETPNALISPDGNLNASKFVTNNTGVDIKYVNIPVVQNTTYTYSFYCNYVGGLGLQGRFYDNTNGANIEYYDYMNQLESGKWKRVTRTFTTPSGCSNIQIWYLAASSSQPVTAYYWGAQLEVGSYATSYIPTSGSAVTRVADACNNGGNDQVINSSEGVLYADISALADDGTFRNISLNNGTTAQSVRIYYRNTTNQITVLIGSAVGGSTTINVANAYTFNKIAVAYQNDNAKVFVNGVLEATISNITMPTGLNQIEFDISNALPFYGKCKDLKVYNTALTDQELIALTTI